MKTPTNMVEFHNWIKKGAVGKNFIGCLEKFEEALKKEKDCGDFYKNLGTLITEMKKVDEQKNAKAVTHLRQSLQNAVKKLGESYDTDEKKGMDWYDVAKKERKINQKAIDTIIAGTNLISKLQ